MSRPRKLAWALAVAALLSCALGAASALAAAAPAWSIRAIAAPTNFAPGDTENDDRYEVLIANAGTAPTDGSPIALTDVLPAGLPLAKVDLFVRSAKEPTQGFNYGPTACTSDTTAEVTTVHCTVSNALPEASEPTLLLPNEVLRMVVHVATPASLGGKLENLARVEGGGAQTASVSTESEATTESPAPGFSEFHAEPIGQDGQPDLQAGSHPFEYTTSFAVRTEPSVSSSTFPLTAAGGDLKDIEVALPPGLVGNPTSTELCTQQQFANAHLVILPGGHNTFPTDCPDGSAIGLVALDQLNGVGVLTPYPLYNLVAPKGMPAQFGFDIAGAPIYIDTRVRTGGDYGVTAFLPNTSQARPVGAASVTIWGDPSDPRHDPLRGACVNEGVPFSLGNCPAGPSTKPFLRLPTSCESPLRTEMNFDTWVTSTLFRAPLTTPAPEGCDSVPFAPTISAQPQTAADSPSGLAFDLHLPQDEDPAHTATSDLRDATVTLPAGVTVNPAAAGGLAACSPAQIDLEGSGPADCPDASKIGSVEVKTPLLDHPVKGGVFVASQSQNPFGSLLAIYVAADDPQTGVVVKLAGKVEPDPVTGQLATRFAKNPQLPFEDLTLSFFDGPRAPLRTPPRCGTYTTTSDLRPYSAPGSLLAAPSDSFSIAHGPGGGPCPTGAVEPKLSAGLANATAGSHSPFSLRLYREDGSDEFAALTATTPPGLAARLRGIPYCPEAGIAQALSRTAPGDGALELASPSCPAASQVGTASAAAGAGPSPFLTHGRVYLAGPYKGAPLSLLTVVPAIAGPFDLGAVAVRVALRVDQTTAQVSAESDRLPRILAGIPLDVREIRVDLDRPDFTVAPTNCTPMAVRAAVLGVGGSSATASDRFQVGDCAALGFAPSLSLRLRGGTKRSGHPALHASLDAAEGQANIARTVVTLPPGEQIDNAHINNPCTRVQFDAGQCPPSSVLGEASATSPLLDQPLEGPVYFRANGGEHLLPDIVADLRGQIHIVLVGHVDAVKTHKGTRIRTSFETVPDAPVSTFALDLLGGKRGLLVNNRDICARRYRAEVEMDGQNGRLHDFEPLVRTSCGAKGKGGHRAH
jgi:hypothetical protein